MPFTPFTYERHLEFLLDTIRQKVPEADLSPGSFWQIWAQGQARGLAGVTSALSYTLRQILPDTAVGVDLDHHAHVYDLPRLQPAKAEGYVLATTTAPIEVFPSDLYAEDLTGRRYDLSFEGHVEGVDDVPFAGTFQLEAVARIPGATGNQSPEVPLTIANIPEPPGELEGLQPQVTVLDPGLTDGRDLEKDPDLQNRIVDTVSGVRLTDTIADYRAWVLGAPDVAETFVYQDPDIQNRVYVLALQAAPDRIGPVGFLQDVFNELDRHLPVTVDTVTPRIEESPIDVTLYVKPKSHARWDWFGWRKVEPQTPPTESDRVIKLLIGDDLDPLSGDGGVEGLEAGMRVLINGDERVIGHVDREDSTIVLVNDLRAIPLSITEDMAMVYASGPATARVQEAIEKLFELLGPLHKVVMPARRKHNILASVITDAVMELDDVYDVHVKDPENLVAAELLENEAYVEGDLAYLPVPGIITVIPWVDGIEEEE